MYESRITFKIKKLKPQTMVIATESHPEDIANDIWQSLVFDRLMYIKRLNPSDTTIISVSLLGGDSKKKPVITTETQLDAHVDSLPESEVRMIVKQIAGLVYVEDDKERTLNLDKELSGADFIEEVSQILTSRGIMPTN